MTPEQSTYDPVLDERLRQELSALDLPPLDPAALTTTGARTLRRRRLATTGGVTIAALAIAIGSYAASNTLSRNAAPAPPAASSSGATAIARLTARLEPFTRLGTDRRAVDAGKYARLAVTWHSVPLSTGEDLTYSTYAADGTLTTIGGSSTRGLNPNGVTWGTPGPESHVIVGILPAAARQFVVALPSRAEGGHASTSVARQISGSPWQAFGVFFAEGEDVGSVRDVLWSDATRVVRDQDGSALPSVSLGDRNDTVLVVAERAGVLASFTRGGTAGQVPLTGRPATSPRPVLDTARVRGGHMEGLFAMLVPAGSRSPRVTALDATFLDGPQIVAVPGTDRAVLWVEYRRHESASGAALSEVSWTGRDGTRTTVTSY